MEWHCSSRTNHQLYALLANHVGYLVRVADSAYRTVLCCGVSKRCGQHHRALDMHMRIDEAGEDIGGIGRHFASEDATDDAILYNDLAIEHLFVYRVHDMAASRERARGRAAASVKEGRTCDGEEATNRRYELFELHDCYD